MVRARLAAALVLVALVGCGDDGAGGPDNTVPDHACTEIGCLPAATIVELSGLGAESLAVTVCVEQQCSTLRGRGDELREVSVALPERAGDSVRVVVEARSGRRVLAKEAGVVPVRSERPNGPHCPPVCRLARARLDVGGGPLEAV